MTPTEVQKTLTDMIANAETWMSTTCLLGNVRAMDLIEACAHARAAVAFMEDQPLAAEWERLYKERDRLWREAGDKADALQAEVARLRAALTCILRCTDDQQAEKYARTALAPTTKEKP